MRSTMSHGAHYVAFPLLLEQNVLHGCYWWLLSLKPYWPNIYLLTVLPVLLLTPQCSLLSCGHCLFLREVLLATLPYAHAAFIAALEAGLFLFHVQKFRALH